MLNASFLDSLVDYMAETTDNLMRSMTSSPVHMRPQFREREVPRLYVDTARKGEMSMLQWREGEPFVIEYDIDTDVNEDDLISWWRMIEANDNQNGYEMAARILEPFIARPSWCIDQAWLNSNEVATYISGLQSPNLQVIDPGYYQSNFLEGINPRRNWAINLKNASKILWPICEENHWYLMFLEKQYSANVSKNSYTIKVLDGFNSLSKHAVIAANGKQLLQKLYNGHVEVANPDHPSYLVPAQDNAIDCGTVVCYYAYKSAQGMLLSKYNEYSGSRCNYIPFRMHIAKEIAQNALLKRKPPLLQPRKPCVIEILDDKSEPKTQRRRTIKA